MGNNRFRLSDMMPNAWFYKLRDMNKPHRKHSSKKTTSEKVASATFIPNRASYYFPSNSHTHPKATHTHFPSDSPRKPATRTPRNPKPAPSPSESDNCCICKKVGPSSADIVLELELRPILTKPTKKQQQQQQQQEEIKKSPARRSVSLRSRPNTPAKKVRIAPRRRTARGIAESFAVVKSSSDPKRDFKESMVEMITEYDLKSAKKLEELLACYLSLNADEYHDMIVNVFGEVWFDVMRK